VTPDVADDTIEAGQPEQGLEFEEEELPADNVEPEPDDLSGGVAPQAEQPRVGPSAPSPEPGQVEGQDLAAAGQPPQHPDTVDITAMTDEEYADWATQNPAAARRMSLRLQDYRQKTETLAREREQLEADRRDLYAAAEQLEAETGGQSAEGQPSAAESSALLAEADRYWNELREKLGRDPYQAEFQTYLAKQVVAETVGPVQQQQAERDRRDSIDRFTEQMAELQEKYPEATEPGIDMQLAKKLDEWGSNVGPGAVEEAFLALKGPGLLEAARAGKTQARQQQRQQAEQQPPVAPAAAPGEAGLPDTSDLKEIARRQRARMRRAT